MTSKPNKYNYFEIQEPICQVDNSCWMNTCLNMIAMVPELITGRRKVDILLVRIRKMSQIEKGFIQYTLRDLLTEIGKSTRQFEVVEGMEFLKSIIKSKKLTIYTENIPDVINISNFIIFPYWYIWSVRGDLVSDILVNKKKKYRPIAWIYRRGDLINGHCYLIYRTAYDKLVVVDSLKQNIEYINKFPVINNTNNIEFILYRKL